MQITRSTFLALTNISEPRLNGLVREGFVDTMGVGVSTIFGEAVDGIREAEKYVKRDYTAKDAVAFRLFAALTGAGLSSKAAARLVGCGRRAIDDGIAQSLKSAPLDTEIFAVWVEYADGNMSALSGPVASIAGALDFGTSAPRRENEELGFVTPFIERFRAESISLQVFEVQRAAQAKGWSLDWAAG